MNIYEMEIRRLIGRKGVIMKILHYLLGLPPVRTGGLVKYALDLAEAQSAYDEVYLLIPGAIAIKREKRFRIAVRRAGSWKKVPVYRVNNPLPIPMGNGIADIDEFTLPCNGEQYGKFLKKLKPDMIHMHTLMGIHREFLTEAKALKIPVIFTTHDYFGICPTVNLFCKDNICSAPYVNCGECSRFAFSEKRLLLEQSAVYRLYRKSNFMIQLLRMDILKGLMKSMRSNVVKEGLYTEGNNKKNDYQKLRNYYNEMFRNVTYFHFNSDVSRSVYEQNLGSLPGEVVYVSNSSVKDRRRIKQSDGKLKIGFLGGDSAFKGLKFLQEVVNELYASGMEQIELQVYGSLTRTPYPFCKYYDSFLETERDLVFERMDVLAVPSKWLETFGMVVLEALSYGVPVMVSYKVGAQALLNQNGKPFGVVLQDSTEEWKACIAELYRNREKIRSFSENIGKTSLELDYALHVNRIRRVYENCVRMISCKK